MNFTRKLALCGIAACTLALPYAAHAETGTWHRYREYDIGNPGHQTMTMQDCARMMEMHEEMHGMEGMDGGQMPCCKKMMSGQKMSGKMSSEACRKMMKSGKSGGKPDCCPHK